MNICQAKRSRDGGSIECGRCGIQWDIDDQDRPQCRTDKAISKTVGFQALQDIRQGLEADIVHKCNNCEFNKIHYCEKEQWISGPGADKDTLTILMNVDNSKCAKWRLKR